MDPLLGSWSISSWGQLSHAGCPWLSWSKHKLSCQNETSLTSQRPSLGHVVWPRPPLVNAVICLLLTALVLAVASVKLPWWLSWQRIHLQCRRPWFGSWVGKIHWRRERLPTPVFLGFPCGSAGKESTCNVGDLRSIPGLGRCPGEGKSYPLQYPGLENSMDFIVHGGVAKSWTQLSDFHFLFSKAWRREGRDPSFCPAYKPSKPWAWRTLIPFVFPKRELQTKGSACLVFPPGETCLRDARPLTRDADFVLTGKRVFIWLFPFSCPQVSFWRCVLSRSVVSDSLRPHEL